MAPNKRRASRDNPKRRNDSLVHSDDACSVALVIIDMINGFDFPDAKELLKRSRPLTKPILALKQKAFEVGVPTIYVNDNFGKWRSDFKALVAHCARDDAPGEELAKSLKPTTQDYFVLKPKHSAFLGTCFDLLLEHLQVQRLILTGIAADICVQFTANDALMRGFEVYVPRDCIASRSEAAERRALISMKNVLHMDTRSSDELNLEELF